MNLRDLLARRTAAPVAAALLGLATAASAPAGAQESAQEWLDRCAEGRMNSNRVTHCEVREATMAAPARLEVNSAPNGGIRVTGGSGSEVHVVARIQSWGRTDAAARSVA